MTMLLATFTTLLGLITTPALQDQGGAEALVERIKQQLGEVDRALQEAADADAVAGELDDARTAHLAVIRDIESLINEIKYQRSQQGGGGGGPSQPRPQGGESPPSDGPPPPPRESDGEGAPEPQQGDESQPGGESESQQEGSEEQTGDEQPKGGGPDPQSPRQEDGSNPPPPESVRYTREDTDARWGLLPPKMQERLMNLHVDDVPERYRAWMDAYIRELNRLEQGGRRP